MSQAELEWLRLLGQRIYKVRSAQGQSLEQFGNLVGVRGATIHRWERGLLIPDVIDLLRISRQFHVPFRALLEEGYEQPARPDPVQELLDSLRRIERKLERIEARLEDRGLRERIAELMQADQEAPR